jgi:release factor glutamine methyltransferase
VLDLGTGGGAIALALAGAWPGAAFTAADLSDEAFALAGGNAAASGHAGRVSLVRSDWFGQLAPDSRFDLIVANPPYLSAEETAQATPEVRQYDPPLALTAGNQGLDALSEIVRAAPRFLAPGGLLALETGVAHHPELLRLAAENGFKKTESLKDLTGRDRFILAWI